MMSCYSETDSEPQKEIQSNEIVVLHLKRYCTYRQYLNCRGDAGGGGHRGMHPLIES